jgi:hypothetical protein
VQLRTAQSPERLPMSAMSRHGFPAHDLKRCEASSSEIGLGHRNARVLRLDALGVLSAGVE